MDTTPEEASQVLDSVKELLNTETLKLWFPTVNFKENQLRKLLWTVSTNVIFVHGVKCELTGYKETKLVKLSFTIYPNITDGCCGCPPEYFRDIEINEVQWEVDGVLVVGKNPVVKTDGIGNKLSQCCEYLKSKLEWPWSDEYLELLNKPFYEFCKNSTKTTRKSRIAKRHNK